MNNDQKIVVGLVMVLISGAVFFGWQQYQKKENVETPLVQNSQPQVQVKTYVNENDGYRITMPTEITVGLKSENSVLGTVQKPISGIYIGHAVLITLDTPELKTIGKEYIKKYENLVNLKEDITRPSVSCSKTSILNDSYIINCIGEGGQSMYGYLKGKTSDVFVDAYSQGFPTKNLDFVTFKTEEDFLTALSTFKFDK